MSFINYFKEDSSDFIDIGPSSIKKDRGNFNRSDLAYNPLVDQINTFWIVTKANSDSTIEDIAFEINLKDFGLQILGGLKFSDIIAVVKTRSQAMNIAQEQIENNLDI